MIPKKDTQDDDLLSHDSSFADVCLLGLDQEFEMKIFMQGEMPRPVFAAHYELLFYFSLGPLSFSKLQKLQ